MIAKLKGLLDETGADWAVIDVGGVGIQQRIARHFWQGSQRSLQQGDDGLWLSGGGDWLNGD